ncbi:MAG: 3-deoxy-D-manno-octulosonic acid transferase [Bacteroidota bacterium]
MNTIINIMWLYRVSIYLYQFAARILAFFNPKALQLIQGRKRLLQHIAKNIPDHQTVIWFHCASLGEFEQGRPIIEQWKSNYPHHFILLTFFSPSGYEIQKNYKGADYVTYLPFDTPKNAEKFLTLTHPDLAIFIKYEFWLNFIDTLDKKHIPLYLASGIFRKNQHFFQWYGKIFRKRLQKFRYFFLQNQESAKLLSSIGINNHKVTGDTRFDRVNAIAKNRRHIAFMEAIHKDNVVFVGGSTWIRDEELFINGVIPLLKDNIKLILAPHQITAAHLQWIRQKFPVDKTLFWTDMTSATKADQYQIIIVDTMGLLSSLYQYADLAYIGGGFGKGIHNTLEAATFGIPVVFGPNHSRFQEAQDLLKQDAAFAINNQSEFNTTINRLITDDTYRLQAGRKAGQYVQENCGATANIINMLSKDFEQV